MIPSKVTQQVVLAGRVLRDSQELVTACNVSHSRDAPIGSQGFPPFARRLWGCNGGFRSRSAVTGACGAPCRLPGRGAACRSARPRLPNNPVFSRCCKKATLRKPLSPQRTWVHRGTCAPPNPNPDGDQGVPEALGASRTGTSGSLCTGAGSGDLVPLQSQLCPLSPACAVLATGRRACGPESIGRQRRRPP